MWTHHRHKTCQYTHKNISVCRMVQYILSLQNTSLPKMFVQPVLPYNMVYRNPVSVFYTVAVFHFFAPQRETLQKCMLLLQLWFQCFLLNYIKQRASKRIYFCTCVAVILYAHISQHIHYKRYLHCTCGKSLLMENTFIGLHKKIFSEINFLNFSICLHTQNIKKIIMWHLYHYFFL
jgi:hypothetical protein